MKNRPLPLIALFILSTFFACVTDTGVVIIPSADPLDVARQYIEQDDYPRALAYLEENTDLNSPIKQWEVLANLYLTNNNLASAKDAFMTLLSLEENHAQSMAALAKIAFIEGDYATQKRLLDQAQALDPNNIDVLIALGNYHYFNENNGRARELYTKANSIEKTPIGLGNLGRIEYQEENLETADLLLTEAIRLDPADAQLYQARHLVYRDQEKYRSSLNDISTAISLSPADEWLYLDRARLYWQDWKQPERSGPDLQKALDLNPDNNSALSLLAETKLLTGDVPGSYEAFKTILERDLQDDRAYPKVSLLAFAIGEYQEARDLIEGFISLYPREIAFPLISAISDIALGNRSRAVRTLSTAKRQHEINSLEFHTLDYIQNPGSDFSFRNAFAQNQNQALKSRVKFYVGMFQRVSGIESLAQSNFEESVALIERGVIERSIALYLLDDKL